MFSNVKHRAARKSRLLGFLGARAGAPGACIKNRVVFEVVSLTVCCSLNLVGRCHTGFSAHWCLTFLVGLMFGVGRMFWVGTRCHTLSLYVSSKKL